MRPMTCLSIFDCLLAVSLASAATPASDGPVPRPTPEQAVWQDLELGMFFHFDISTFTDDGEGDWPRQGHLDPNLYHPAKLNTDQWLEAAKALGAGYTVFVAKHCTGFISWQSDAYPYGVRQSKWRNGKGDVVADYVASCRKYGIKPGIYCSMPANACCDVFDNCMVKGASGPNDPRQVEYRRRAERLVTELWGNYGPLTYIWFDGGTLPPDKGGPDLVPILKRLQPHAVTFQGPPDNPAGNTRWPGNEQGVTAYPSWSTVAQANDSGAGNPRGKVWQPGECDAPLREHDWFWHPKSEGKIRSVDQLVEMYYQSVGRGCNLILNGNIDRDGLVPEADLKRFKEFGDEIRRRFGKSIAETSGRGSAVELALAKPAVIDHAIIMEQIGEGERIRRYVLEGLIGDRWTELARGQSIGHKRIERFHPIEVTRVRVRATETVAEPVIRKLAVYHVGPATHPKPIRIVIIGDSTVQPYPHPPADRRHFSGKGARAIAGLIAEAIPEVVPDLRPCLTAKPPRGQEASPALLRERSASVKEAIRWLEAKSKEMILRQPPYHEKWDRRVPTPGRWRLRSISGCGTTRTCLKVAWKPSRTRSSAMLACCS